VNASIIDWTAFMNADVGWFFAIFLVPLYLLYRWFKAWREMVYWRASYCLLLLFAAQTATNLDDGKIKMLLEAKAFADWAIKIKIFAMPDGWVMGKHALYMPKLLDTK